MLREGETLGPYRLEKKLGGGAYGMVFLAEPVQGMVRVPVALKVPYEQSNPLELVVEAKVWLRAGGHPNIVPVLGADVYDGLFVIASEYVEGGSLRDRIGFRSGKGLPPAEVARLASGILGGLEHLHARGVIHRDLKPDNILLQSGVPRLTDFGVAKVLTRTRGQGKSSGTVMYMPPEAFAGQVSAAADVWSVGVILYELLTGRLPFDGENEFAIMDAIRGAAPPPLPPSVPPRLRAVIERALAKDPEARFKSAAEMRCALERGWESPAAPVAPTPRPTHTPCRPAGEQPPVVPAERIPSTRDPVAPTLAEPVRLTVRVNPQDGAEMVWIPSGEFLMGTDAAEVEATWTRLCWPDAWKHYTKDEAPTHRVRVSGFWLYRHLVTVAQYRQFCRDRRRPMPGAPSWGWIDTHPVVNVSWTDAQEYCDWARARLPTEAEWERAVRGPNTGVGGTARSTFVWGDDLPKGAARVGNLADESAKRKNTNWTIFDGYEDGFVNTAPVGSFNESSWRLHDMAGNVWEWCADWYAEDYYRKSPSEDPPGPERTGLKVLRGGSWFDSPDDLRAAGRDGYDPGLRNDILGFRPARSR